MIEIEDLSLDLGEFHLRHVDLLVRDGEYVALLGPTGSGKTVLLECVVGLHRRHAGRVLVDGVDVTRLFPEERNVGYVPQDYALFPNLTVTENLAYGLKARRTPKERLAAQVGAMLAQLRLQALAGRYPLHLSGGEQQRVAIGRALLPGPRALLLDEPLSALDEGTRSELAAELRATQRAANGAFLHVCHNLDEALEVADRIAVFRDGALVQVGTPAEILLRPASRFVATFTRTRNLLPGLATPAAAGTMVQVDGGPRLRAAVAAEGRVVVAIRPERIEVAGDAADAAPENELCGVVVRCAPRLAHLEVEVDVGRPLIAYLGYAAGRPPPAAGAEVRLRIPPTALHLLPEA
jgi:ABC-type Fe3+/spermidine/putrescine transport system ATPase subunit